MILCHEDLGKLVGLFEILMEIEKDDQEHV